MGGKLERWFIPAVIAFAPLLTFLMTWNVAAGGKLVSIVRAFSLPELGAELVVILVAFVEGMAGSWRPARGNRIPLIALALLLLVAFGTVAIAPDTIVAAYRTGFWVVHLLFGLAIAFLCGRAFDGRDLVRTYMLGFVAFAAAFALWGLLWFHRPIDWTRELPAVLHIRHLGIYATPIIGLAIGVMATDSRRGPWLGACAVAASGFALALWTGARGPVMAIAVALVAGAVLAPAPRRLAAWGGALLSLAAAWLAVNWLPVPAGNMGVGRTISATTQSADIGTGRSAMWNGVIHAIERQPVFGYGEGQMQAVAPFYTMAQPHNLVLQLLLAWGVVGLVCCTVLGLWFALRAVPAVRGDEERLLGPLLAMIALLALSMIDAALYHILPISIFAACAGMIASKWAKKGEFAS